MTFDYRRRFIREREQALDERARKGDISYYRDSRAFYVDGERVIAGTSFDSAIRYYCQRRRMDFVVNIPRMITIESVKTKVYECTMLPNGSFRVVEKKPQRLTYSE